MRIFVVGSFVVSCCVKVARLPRAGESLDATAFLSEAGGKGFNLALAALRLGADIDGVFSIGDDPFAEIAVSTFRQVGLSQEMLVRRTGSTGAGVGFVDPAGENCLAVSLGANALLTVDDVAARACGLDASRLVMATFESPDGPIRTAFARARARGSITVLNPSPTRPIDPQLLADTSILIVNRVEADDLGLGPAEALATAVQTPAAIDALMRSGPGTIVVTLGDDGAVAFDRDRPPYRQPAYGVPAVDTIGAGDAFAAGFAVALLEGRPTADALRWGAACGALATCRFGAFDAFPTAVERDRFLARRDAFLEPSRG